MYIYQRDFDDYLDDDPIAVLNMGTRAAKTFHDRAAAHRIESAEWALRIQRQHREDAEAEALRAQMEAAEEAA